MEAKNFFRIYLAIGSVALLTFIGVLNETSMNVTYPELSAQFKVSLDVVQWITTGYLLMVTVTMGTTAYLLRQYAARWLHLFAVSFFIVGDLMCALTINFPILLTGRLIQAVATGLATPIMFHLIFTEIPRERIGMMTGLAGMVISFAPALGPTYGGVVSETLSWRMIFWILLPIVLISLLGGQLFIRNKPLGNDKAFSYASLITLAIALVSTISAVATVGKHGFSFQFWLLLLVAIIFFAIFIYVNNHGKSSLFDLRVFKVIPLRLSTLTYFNLQFINIGISLVIPIYIQYVLHSSAIVAGLVLLPGSLIGAFVSPIAGNLADRQGFVVPVVTGGCLLVVGTICFSIFQQYLTPLFVMIFFVILRIGFNFAFSNTISNASMLVQAQNAPDVNSIFNMVQQFAGSLGTSLLASAIALFQAKKVGSLAGRTYDGGRFDFILLGIIAVVTLLTMIANYHLQKKGQTSISK
ncbi:MFS transporter [Limosilactobacillus sp. STM2_1]|uniref:MFS transporter n=1 Tax=Limosilactobacillus rudii TaxID=2759755 RepID=A0A7W3YPK6_9LACO|nr:MFS transporter [Limosilactobacillus rudii]MBB1080451.1 MFS transporter [Limosilactobacillus rudii]MBB1098477.1 MFS transporter [Limosilactobacillus rudii]MCD7135485.1 MFS transporter [Limosilactobacillus rudii]